MGLEKILISVPLQTRNPQIMRTGCVSLRSVSLPNCKLHEGRTLALPVHGCFLRAQGLVSSQQQMHCEQIRTRHLHSFISSVFPCPSIVMVLLIYHNYTLHIFLYLILRRNQGESYSLAVSRVHCLPGSCCGIQCCHCAFTTLATAPHSPFCSVVCIVPLDVLSFTAL